MHFPAEMANCCTAGVICQQRGNLLMNTFLGLPQDSAGMCILPLLINCSLCIYPHRV